jgi:hypothetical protein
MRYASKGDFIEDIRREHQTLLGLLQEVPDEDFLVPGVCGKWSLKDILAHLSEWHRLALNWYQTGLKNAQPEMPKRGYKWNQLHELNHEFYLKHRDKSLTGVRSMFTRSHKQIMKLIEALPENELLQPGFYDWTTKYPLTTYLHPNTSGHYRWAIKHIKKWLKKRK